MEKLQARKKVYLWLLILLESLRADPVSRTLEVQSSAGDDYGYAYRTFQIWRETHSFWNVIKKRCHISGVLSEVAGALCIGGSAGAGTGNFRRQILRADRNLAARNHCGVKLRGYGLYHFTVNRVPETGGICCRTVMSFLMIEWMPSALQGLYWYNGAMNYVFFHAVLYCFLEMRAA